MMIPIFFVPYSGNGVVSPEEPICPVLRAFSGFYLDFPGRIALGMAIHQGCPFIWCFAIPEYFSENSIMQ